MSEAGIDELKEQLTPLLVQRLDASLEELKAAKAARDAAWDALLESEARLQALLKEVRKEIGKSTARRRLPIEA